MKKIVCFIWLFFVAGLFADNVRFELAQKGENVSAYKEILLTSYQDFISQDGQECMKAILEKHWQQFATWVYEGKENFYFMKALLVHDDKPVGFFTYKFFDGESPYLVLHSSPLLKEYQSLFFTGLLHIQNLKQFSECKKIYAAACSNMPEGEKFLQQLGFKKDDSYPEDPELAKNIEGIVGYSRDL